MSLIGSGTISTPQFTAYVDSGATWTDNVDGTGSALTGHFSATGSFALTGSVNVSVAGTYTITYRKVDAEGNINSVTRTIVVTPPNSGGS